MTPTPPKPEPVLICEAGPQRVAPFLEPRCDACQRWIVGRGAGRKLCIYCALDCGALPAIDVPFGEMEFPLWTT